MPATLVPPAQCADDQLLDDCPTVPAVRGELVTTLGLRHVGPRRVRLRYEVVGADGLPVVAVLGGISADRHVCADAADPSPGWWDAQVGPGRPLDPRRHQVVAIDWVGADGDVDAPIDTADQADALITVLEHLGVTRLGAFVGCSYGALVGLQLAVRHRHRVGRLVAISGSSRPNPYAAAYRALQRQVVDLGLATGRGTDALAIARQLGMLSYRTPDEFAARFPQPAALVDGTARSAAQDYLDACGSRYAAQWSPVAFRRLSESIDLHVVDPAAIRVPCTFAAVEGDWLVPPAEVHDLAARVDAPASVHVIVSRYGHDAFLKETEQVAAVLGAGLEPLGVTTGATVAA